MIPGSPADKMHAKFEFERLKLLRIVPIGIRELNVEGSQTVGERLRGAVRVQRTKADTGTVPAAAAKTIVRRYYMLEVDQCNDVIYSNPLPPREPDGSS
jgi:hypothetical protein